MVVFPVWWFWFERKDLDADTSNDWIEVAVVVFSGCMFWFDPGLEISSLELQPWLRGDKQNEKNGEKMG